LPLETTSALAVFRAVPFGRRRAVGARCNIATVAYSRTNTGIGTVRGADDTPRA
jgi:hypothetical protein